MPSPGISSIRQMLHRIVEDQQLRELPDHELLRRFQGERDETAFHSLVSRHGPMVLDVCRGVLSAETDVEDAFQATFLILARKAASIRQAASVAAWLHGVAYRTALKARSNSAARQHHESQAVARQTEATDELTWREVREVLHEEINGLAERHRAPLVLCYLEGKGQDEAAALLGLPKGTLKGRLERARELLRLRLVRGGWDLLRWSSPPPGPRAWPPLH